MDSISSFQQSVEVLYRQAREQTAAIKSLGDVFDQETSYLVRHDQAVCLRSLRIRVLGEVDNIQELETAAGYGFNEAALITGMTELALSGLLAAIIHNRHAFSIGTHLAEGDLTRKAPFGNVMVAVGHGGLPDDVKVISLSRLAREADRPESDIEAALQNQGYLLMTPEAFSSIVTELERIVLDGSLSLPVTIKQYSGGLLSH